MKKKIGFILVDYQLGTASSIINSAIVLADNYEVHIFIEESVLKLCDIDFKNDKITVHRIKIPLKYKSNKNKKLNLRELIAKKFNLFNNPTNSNIIKSLYHIFHKISFRFSHQNHLNELNNKTFGDYSKNFFPELVAFSGEVGKYIDNEYLCIIGVESKGIITSNLINKSFEVKIPLIYYNLELLLENECKTIPNKILKYLERYSVKNCVFSIIQDKNRAKYFLRDNNVSENEIVLVPVSGLRNPFKSKSNFIYDFLKIPENKKIIIYAGSIADFSYSLEVARGALKWSKDLVLVLHSAIKKYENKEQNEYIKEVKKIANQSDNIYLSLKPLEWDDLPLFLSSADIGLAFYKDFGKNYSEIANSSNKIVQYLQVGMPVITSDFDSLVELIDNYKCGKFTDKPEKLESLIIEILSNYDFYRNNAFKCYHEEFNFNNYFDEVIKRIQELEPNPCYNKYR